MEYSFIGWIVVGLIAGALAKWIMPGKDPGGIIVTILIGIAGACWAASWLACCLSSRPAEPSGTSFWRRAARGAAAVDLSPQIKSPLRLGQRFAGLHRRKAFRLQKGACRCRPPTVSGKAGTWRRAE